jgi:phosphoribosylaminoimidazole-succinocarboxamide synthase
MKASPAVSRTEIPGIPVRRGKVRDVYDLGDRLVIVATDRISAFDWVLPTPIPGKGKLLTQMTLFWFHKLGVKHHLLDTDLKQMGPQFAEHKDQLSGRTMLVKKADVVPFECVVRGYLAGSGWKEYQQSQSVCGIKLPAGLREAQQLPEPIFTPATKAETGHDENVSFEFMADNIGKELADDLKAKSLDVYTRAARYATERGIILADTKFEWGRLKDGSVILIDEVLTPDSSRYWPSDEYRPGSSPASFDKQFVRDWLESTKWDKQSEPPALPASVVEKTAAKYQEAYERITSPERSLKL